MSWIHVAETGAGTFFLFHGVREVVQNKELLLGDQLLPAVFVFGGIVALSHGVFRLVSESLLHSSNFMIKYL